MSSSMMSYTNVSFDVRQGATIEYVASKLQPFTDKVLYVIQGDLCFADSFDDVFPEGVEGWTVDRDYSQFPCYTVTSPVKITHEVWIFDIKRFEEWLLK
jgi:hypothetical protein